MIAIILVQVDILGQGLLNWVDKGPHRYEDWNLYY